MQFEIITPEKVFYEGEINLVKVPGSEGSFELLHNHAPIVSSLDEGYVRVIAFDGEIFNFKISGGVLEMVDNAIKLLAEKCEEIKD